MFGFFSDYFPSVIIFIGSYIYCCCVSMKHNISKQNSVEFSHQSDGDYLLNVRYYRNTDLYLN